MKPGHVSRPLVFVAFRTGIRKGWHGFVWMMKILVPISLFIAVLDWSGWIHHLDFLVQPAMALLSLPPMAALPLVIGVLTGVYGGIAAMSVLPFTLEQMTLMAIFLLICHNVFQETVVQAKSGIHWGKALVFRFFAAVVTVMAVAPFLGPTDLLDVPAGTAGVVRPPFIPMLEEWLISTVLLALKIFLIVMGLLTMMEILQTLGWIQRMVAFGAPIFRLFGLSPQAGMIWFTALVFGLAYGAAVIVEEASKGEMTREELEDLHLSIGIHHAVIEDPSLFLALGLQPFWLWVPRLVAAILAVHLLRIWHRVTGQGAGQVRTRSLK